MRSERETAIGVAWVRLQLDFDTFDDGEFEPYLYEGHDAGIGFTTMAEFGDTAACRRGLYELNRARAADIPERGEFYTYEQYLADRIATPSYDPRGVVLAIDRREWVGMAATSLNREAGYAFSEMTGVLPSHRRRGISVAMKLLAIRFTRDRGYRWLRTFHHPDNASAIAMNRRLGFVAEEPDRWPAVL